MKAKQVILTLLSIRNGFFQGYSSSFGSFPIVIPIVNSISNLDHEGVEPLCKTNLW